jgi:hypothetical protein
MLTFSPPLRNSGSIFGGLTGGGSRSKRRNSVKTRVGVEHFDYQIKIISQGMY